MSQHTISATSLSPAHTVKPITLQTKPIKMTSIFHHVVKRAKFRCQLSKLQLPTSSSSLTNWPRSQETSSTTYAPTTTFSLSHRLRLLLTLKCTLQGRIFTKFAAKCVISSPILWHLSPAWNRSTAKCINTSQIYTRNVVFKELLN